MRALLLLLALLPGLAWAEVTLDAAQEARYRTMTYQLRCLVCQNESIADSNAPLAQDLRDQVKTQIVAGKSDDEIRQYLTARYGDFVLYKPPFKPITLLLWLGPLLLIALALVVAFVYSRRTARAATLSAADAEKLKRLLDSRQ